MGRFDISSGEEFASFDKQEIKDSTAYVTRRLVKKLEAPSPKKELKKKTKQKEVVPKRHVISSESEIETTPPKQKRTTDRKKPTKQKRAILVSDSEEDLPKSVLDELQDNPEIEPAVNDRLSDTSSSNSPIVVLERSKVKPIPNPTTSSDSDKEIEFNLIKENLPCKSTRSKTTKTSNITPSRKRKVTDDSNDGYSPLISGPSDESCLITPQATKKKIEEKIGRSEENNFDETPKRSNVKETISKQKTRSKRLMKDVIESHDNVQVTPEPLNQVGEKQMLNEQQLKELGVKMMFEMPSEKRSSHIKQAWKAPRLSNGRTNSNTNEIRSPQSHQIGTRALGMGLSRFARTQPIVRMNQSNLIDSNELTPAESTSEAIEYDS